MRERMQSINNYVFDDFKSKHQVCAEVFENNGFPLNNRKGFDSNSDDSIKSASNKTREEV